MAHTNAENLRKDQDQRLKLIIFFFSYFSLSSKIAGRNARECRSAAQIKRNLQCAPIAENTQFAPTNDKYVIVDRKYDFSFVIAYFMGFAAFAAKISNGKSEREKNNKRPTIERQSDSSLLAIEAPIGAYPSNGPSNTHAEAVKCALFTHFKIDLHMKFDVLVVVRIDLFPPFQRMISMRAQPFSVTVIQS